MNNSSIVLKIIMSHFKSYSWSVPRKFFFLLVTVYCWSYMKFSLINIITVSTVPTNYKIIDACSRMRSGVFSHIQNDLFLADLQQVYCMFAANKVIRRKKTFWFADVCHLLQSCGHNCSKYCKLTAYKQIILSAGACIERNITRQFY